MKKVYFLILINIFNNSFIKSQGVIISCKTDDQKQFNIKKGDKIFIRDTASKDTNDPKYIKENLYIITGFDANSFYLKSIKQKNEFIINRERIQSIQKVEGGDRENTKKTGNVLIIIGIILTIIVLIATISSSLFEFVGPILLVPLLLPSLLLIFTGKSKIKKSKEQNFKEYQLVDHEINFRNPKCQCSFIYQP